MWWESCDRIVCGFWRNSSADLPYRSTLTLPTQWALILIAFLALFVRLAGSYLWSIICFAIHQSKASPALHDDTHHQTQMVLRNTDSEASLAWKLVKVGFAHQGTRTRAYSSTMWLITLAIMHASIISVMGGLSSRLIAGSDEVQTIPGKCGWMKEIPLTTFHDKESFATFSALTVMARYGYRRSANYARSCYGQTSDNSSYSCQIYTQSRLPYDTKIADGCVFDEKICNGSTITFDTGALRSDSDLGINTQPEDAITMRKSLSCTPLNGQKYSTGWVLPGMLDPSLKNETNKVQCFRFGSGLGSNIPQNITDCVSANSLVYGDVPYGIETYSSFVNYTGDQASLFNPIAELQVPDTDLTLISLVNRISYSEPVEDPWFNANNLSTANFYSNRTFTATHPQSWLACGEKYQLCTADTNQCSSFTGLYDIQSPQNLTGLRPRQKAVYDLMWKMNWFAQINFQFIFIGRESLVANDYLWDGTLTFDLSAPLPSGHWQREAGNWMNTSLAALQRAAPAFAQPPDFDVGPGLPVLNYIVEPTGAPMQELCHRIKMRSKAHTSFNVLGLFLLVGIGCLVMLVNAWLPQIAGWFQERRGNGYKMMEWVETGAFQLQRMAAEGRGIGPWRGRRNDVPTLVQPGQQFNLTALSLGHESKTYVTDAAPPAGYHVVKNRDAVEEIDMQIMGVERQPQSVHSSRSGLLKS